LGFTLIEFLITIIVATILATLAAPSFISYIGNQRVRNASNDLASALLIARSEAIKRNAPMSIVRTGAGWDAGWAVQTAGATVVRAQDAYANLSITDSANLSTIIYGIDGRPTAASATTFTVKPSATLSGVTARCVYITPSGTPRSTVSTTLTCS
jgi:type IV fimbrial biogenesis protein FimT